jgi:tetratricopeptide (TPR) repeat protein
MSATRLIIRIFLVAILVGVAGLTFLALRNSKPENMLARAKKAMDADDPGSAVLHLNSMLQRFPKEAEAHYLLAQAALKDAEKKKEPGVTYGTNKVAFEHLLEAANLAPENLAIQKEALGIFIRANKPVEGVKYANNILKEEPDNVDALYVQAAKAAAARDRKAPEMLSQLQAKDLNRHFRLYWLKHEYYSRTGDKAKIQENLDQAVADAAALTKQQVNDMPRLESDAMSKLLRAGVGLAPDATVGIQRASKAVETLEKFPLEVPAVLADVAQICGEIMLNLSSRFSPGADNSDDRAARNKLQARVDSLGEKVVESKQASPVIYHQSALAAFSAGNHEKAAQLLKEGLDAASKMKNVRPRDVLELHLLAARNYVVMRKDHEAAPHLEKLLADKDYAGWGELLSGGIDSTYGRYEKAYGHFSRAERKLGSVLLVDIGLAHTCLELGKWQEALTHLQALHKAFDTGDVEVRAWAAQNEISHASVHFGELRANLQLKRWDEAQPHLAALTNTAVEARAKAMAVSYLWLNGKRSEAVAMLQDARKKFPEDSALFQLELAVAQAAGKPEEVGKLITDSAAAEPGNLYKQLLLVQWMLREKKDDEALKLLDKLEADFPKEMGPSVMKAQALLTADKPDEALAVANKLKERPEAAGVANLIIASAEMAKKNPGAAHEALSAAEASAPNNGLLKLLQARVAASEGNFSEAVSDLAQTLDVTPLRAQAQNLLLRSILSIAAKEGPEKAEAQLQPLVDQNPDDAFLAIALADLKFKQGQFDSAMKLLDRAETLQPGKADVAYIKAGVWRQRGRIDTAYQECERGLSIDPNHMYCRMQATDLALQQGLFKEALHHAKTALDAVPNYPGMVIAYAKALVGLRRQAEAIQFLSKAIEVNPKFDLYYDLMSSLQLEAGQKDAALATIRKGREQLPEDLVVAAAEVRILCRMDKLDEAQSFAKTFTAGQTKPDRLLIMAQAFFAERKFEQALDWGNQALAMADDQMKPGVHYFLGDLNLVTAQFGAKKDPALLEKARDHFAAVIAANPTHFVAGNNLAWLLATEFNQPKEAAEVIDRVRGKMTVEQLPANFIDTLAVVYRGVNRLEEAQEVLERATKMYQDDPQLLYQLAIVQNDRKLYSAARTNIERAIQLGVPKQYEENAKRLLDSLREANVSTPTAKP